MKRVPHKGWKADLGVLNEEEWMEAINWVQNVSILSSQKATQLYILHGVSFTPVKVFQLGKRERRLCLKCQLKIRI